MNPSSLSPLRPRILGSRSSLTPQYSLLTSRVPQNIQLSIWRSYSAHLAPFQCQRKRSLVQPSTSPKPSTYLQSSRHASTISSPTSNASSSASPPISNNVPAQLSWDEFLRLRRVRRYYNLGASVGTSFASLFGGLAIMSQQNLVALSQQMFGLDPFVLLGLCAAGFGVLGWLLGPIVGTSVFRLFHSSKAAGMATKEKDFFERIKKYRVDPSSSSMRNPAPDYYGEKITSVAGYRRWLKDQKAFNKKRQSFV